MADGNLRRLVEASLARGRIRGPVATGSVNEVWIGDGISGTRQMLDAWVLGSSVLDVDGPSLEFLFDALEAAYGRQ